jgi:virginiamycin B lyase
VRAITKRSWGNVLLGLLAVAMVSVIAAGVSAQTAVNEWGIPSTGSQPTNLAFDSFGNVWFTEFSGNRIARVNQNGVFQEYAVGTTDSQPWGIAVDTSNKVWFTEYAGNKIGNMTPQGVFGQDNVPTADSKPAGIAVDSSGNVWFAESAGNKIGKLQPSNSSFSEFSVPTASSQPWGVAIDSAGNVWFTERSANKIGRMTPTGQIDEYGIPTSSSTPTGIAIDASGNVWVAEYDGNKIAMRSPNGTWTEYNIPTSNSKPTWVAIDKMGGIWYAGSGSNSYGRIAGGNVTEFGVPTSNSVPVGIGVDGTGNVWFTEQSANKIGKSAGIAPIPTPTPVYTPQPTPTLVPRDNRYFDATGFRIDNDVFWDYFNKRGALRTFGYPVSRTFTFMGSTVQFFQREIMQIGPSGNAQTMNVLDPGMMEYTRINGSTYPAPDSGIAAQAPVPGTPEYDVRIQEFIKNQAPNQFDGLTVNFYQAFQNTVKLEDAYPQGGANAALLPLLNMEIWGVPTSKPQRDPTNNNFVYLRFQRGIMHFDATNGYTQGLLLADYLKALITGQNLPSDLEGQARASKFYKQYNPTKSNWVDRPDQLPNTNFFYAFEKDGAPLPTPAPSTYFPSAATATAAPASYVSGPTATPAPTFAAVPANIEVVGSTEFVNQVNGALLQLSSKSPYNYGIIKQYVYRINRVDSSTCSIDYGAHILNINDATAFPAEWGSYKDQQQQWLAGLITHNAMHLSQYYRGVATTGADAEREALLRQQDVLAGIESTSPTGQFWRYVQEALDNNSGWFGEWPLPRGPKSS